MSTPAAHPILRNRVFAWIALTTCLILMIPLAAMRLTDAVDWNIADFLVMGLLLFGASSAFVLVARSVRRKYWIPAGIAPAAGLLYVWAELAVGIFTNLGS